MYNNILLAKINYLLAKLTDEQYKPYKELYESMKEEYDKRYSDIFGAGNNRIYLTDNIIKIPLLQYDKKNLEHITEKITIIFNMLEDKFEFKNRYSDILHNRVWEKTGREWRITKLLKMLYENKVKGIDKELHIDIGQQIQNYHIEFGRDLIDDYISNLPPKSILTEDGVNLLVVISKDPYDIAGMSTDRRWTSCMELPTEENSKGGCYSYKIKEDVKLGTIVAYLITEDDKNIEAPYARIAIKPHTNIKTKTVRLFAEDKVYHDNSLTYEVYESFADIVYDFLDKIQPDNIGLFQVNPDLYNDSKKSYKSKGQYDILDTLNIKRLFGFKDAYKYKHYREAIVFSATFNEYEVLFNNVVQGLERLNLYQTFSKIEEYNNNYHDRDMFNFRFYPTLGNYLDKRINYGNNSIKMTRVKEILNSIDFDKIDNNHVVENVERILNITLPDLDKLIDYDNSNFESEITSYNIHLVYNGAGTEKEYVKSDKKFKKRRVTGTSHFGTYNSDYNYWKLFTLYVYDSDKNLEDYIYKLDMDINIDLSQRIHGEIPLSNLIGIGLNCMVDENLIDDDMLSDNNKLLDLIDDAVYLILRDLTQRTIDTGVDKDAE